MVEVLTQYRDCTAVAKTIATIDRGYADLMKFYWEFVMMMRWLSMGAQLLIHEHKIGILSMKLQNVCMNE